MESELVRALVLIKNNIGVDVFLDSNRMNGLLSDIIPSARKDRKIILRIIDAGIMRSFRDDDIARAMGLLKSFLYDEEFISSERAEFYLDVLAEVFNYDRSNNTTTLGIFKNQDTDENESLLIKEDTILQDSISEIERYKKAAALGDIEAQRTVGWYYQNGKGVPQDYQKAYEYSKKAADQGYALAQADIGFMYENGYGVGQDYSMALEWYKKAADQGNSFAQREIGYSIETGKAFHKITKKRMSIPKRQRIRGMRRHRPI